MDNVDITYGKIIDYIRGQNNQIDLMTIQRYFYVLQQSGVTIGFNFKKGITQPYSKTLSRYLEKYDYVLRINSSKKDFSKEFIVLIDFIINIMENPLGNYNKKEWQINICNYLKDIEAEKKYGSKKDLKYSPLVKKEAAKILSINN